ncbi:MAG: hypothetical protein WC595_04345 [Candidatus Nanoarchaeia archaeon]
MFEGIQRRLSEFLFKRKLKEFCKELENYSASLIFLILQMNNEFERLGKEMTRHVNYTNRTDGREGWEYYREVHLIGAMMEQIGKTRKAIKDVQSMIRIIGSSNELMMQEEIPEQYQAVMKKFVKEEKEKSRPLKSSLNAKLAILSDKKIDAAAKNARSLLKYYKEEFVLNLRAYIDSASDEYREYKLVINNFLENVEPLLV